MVFVLDNYDSFTYNLVQYLGELGATLDGAAQRPGHAGRDRRALAPSHIVISPGPGRPEDAGVTSSVIGASGRRVPILGVCLGHQAIGLVYGGTRRARAGAAARQDVDRSSTTAAACSRDWRAPFEAGAVPLAGRRRRRGCRRARSRRAHRGPTASSWACGTASCPLHGVQFHPESVLTDEGRQLLRNFLTAPPCTLSGSRALAACRADRPAARS